MGILLDYLNEASLTPAELAKHGGQYLSALIKMIQDGTSISIDPAYRNKYGDAAYIAPEMIKPLLAAHKGTAQLPKNVLLVIGKETVSAPWGALFKGKEFTGLEGKKTYNAGHLAELFMGLAVAAKFFNLGQPTEPQQVMDMISHITAAVDGKNYKFHIQRQIEYPENSKNDTLAFLAVVPAASAEAFLAQAKARQFAPDLQAIFVSAIKYTNESVSVTESVKRVRADKNNNRVDVISDGSSDAKSTKADLTLKIDGTKVNLLSLKTYSSDTLGQISGTKFEALKEWFMIGFNINIDEYKNQFGDQLNNEQKLKAIFALYDTVIYPQFDALIARQSPGAEAYIVKHLAKAANYYARGSSLENVEIVKLDDKIATGSYKILRFSDSLKEAMSHLDLDLKYIKGKTGKGRTIQIWIKPEADEKVADGANKLCQFRSQVMGGYLRNYFESGPMLETLTHIDTDVPGTELPGDSEVVSSPRARRTSEKPRQRR